MLTTIAFAFGLLVLLTVLIRRFSPKKRSTLHGYLRSHEQESKNALEAMRLEAYRFSPHEALAPVEAALHELIDVHGKPPELRLTREGDNLVLRGRDEYPVHRIDVLWNFRAAMRGNRAQSTHIYGKGQWEIRVNEGEREPYTRLDALMGRLAALLRAMIRAEHAEALQPVAPTLVPGLGEPGPVRPDLATPDLATPDLATHGLAKPDLVTHGLAKPGRVRPAASRLAAPTSGPVVSGLVASGAPVRRPRATR